MQHNPNDPFLTAWDDIDNYIMSLHTEVGDTLAGEYNIRLNGRDELWKTILS